MSDEILHLVPRLASEAEITRSAMLVLRRAGATGHLPTPLDDLISSEEVQDAGEASAWRDRFLASLPRRSRALFEAAWQKIRGIADLRERVVYVPVSSNPPRVQFARAHELGHQVLTWHRVNLAYRDDELSLSPEAVELFDAEANFFAAEVIFQGDEFRRRALDLQPSFDAVFWLADAFGASRHATLRRYVEEHDEAIAMFPYWPSLYTVDHMGNPVLRRSKGASSARFREKYGELEPPAELRSGDPWVSARECSSPCDGDITLPCGSKRASFQWHAWWNSHSLLVLLRMRPSLSFIGRSLGK